MPRLNYPLKFKPVYHEKIWGGDRLNALLNKNSPYKKTGESWEISAVEGNVSVVANGDLAGKNLEQLCKEFPEELMGKKVAERFNNEFPLLIKFIDAAVPLSVQVHPDDEMAEEFDSFGKNEMWVILNNDRSGRIYLGFKENESPESIQKALQEGTVMEKIREYNPGKFDAFQVKAGTIHTIGENVLLAEIQQTSDLTFRLYDFDRADEKGEKRELHIKESLRALKYEPSENVYFPNDGIGGKLIHDQHFKVNKLKVENEYSTDTRKFGSFVVYMCLGGNAEVKKGGTTVELKKGETVLMPFAIGEFSILSSGADLLEIFV